MELRSQHRGLGFQLRLQIAAKMNTGRSFQFPIRDRDPNQHLVRCSRMKKRKDEKMHEKMVYLMPQAHALLRPFSRRLFFQLAIVLRLPVAGPIPLPLLDLTVNLTVGCSGRGRRWRWRWRWWQRQIQRRKGNATRNFSGGYTYIYILKLGVCIIRRMMQVQ